MLKHIMVCTWDGDCEQYTINVNVWNIDKHIKNAKTHNGSKRDFIKQLHKTLLKHNGSKRDLIKQFEEAGLLHKTLLDEKENNKNKFERDKNIELLNILVVEFEENRDTGNCPLVIQNNDDSGNKHPSRYILTIWK